MWNLIFGLLYPPKCIFCRRLLPHGSIYEACGSCLEEIIIDSDPCCRPNSDTPYIDGILCVCSYSGKIRKAITGYKYYSKPSFYRLFARLMSDSLSKAFDGRFPDIVLSVPLYARRLRSRGYNQSLLLSRFIGHKLGIPEKSEILKRVRDTGYQSHLPRNERIRNVSGAFSVNRTADVKGRDILLIDDIFTTGSTLNQCAKVLKDAGAGRVYAAALASTRQFNQPFDGCKTKGR